MAHRSAIPSRDQSANLSQPQVDVSRDTILKAIKRHSKQFSGPGRIRSRPHRKLYAPSNFARSGPAQKIKQLSRASVRPNQLNRFVQDISQANLRKHVRGSLPGIASAFGRCLSFCELTNTLPLSPMGGTVLRRSSVFNDTSTFGGYISHMRKVCFFLPSLYGLAYPICAPCCAWSEKVPR